MLSAAEQLKVIEERPSTIQPSVEEYFGILDGDCEEALVQVLREHPVVVFAHLHFRLVDESGPKWRAAIIATTTTWPHLCALVCDFGERGGPTRSRPGVAAAESSSVVESWVVGGFTSGDDVCPLCEAAAGNPCVRKFHLLHRMNRLCGWQGP